MACYTHNKYTKNHHISDEYLLDGLWHREDGPAVIYRNGKECWYKNGILHRVGAPAIEHKATGKESWYIDGKFHRIDGPAYISDRALEVVWYIDGKRHRIDGPAVARKFGENEWWIDGERMSEEEHQRRVNPVKEIKLSEAGELLSQVILDNMEKFQEMLSKITGEEIKLVKG